VGQRDLRITSLTCTHVYTVIYYISGALYIISICCIILFNAECGIDLLTVTLTKSPLVVALIQ